MSRFIRIFATDFKRKSRSVMLVLADEDVGNLYRICKKGKTVRAYSVGCIINPHIQGFSYDRHPRMVYQYHASYVRKGFFGAGRLKIHIMTIEITTPEEMQNLLQNYQKKSILTETQKQLLKMQEEIIGIATETSPTLIDSSISRLFNQLYQTLESETDSDTKKKAQMSCIESIVTITDLLDANFCARLENDRNIAREILSRAGEGLCKNVRDILLMSNTSISSTVKTAGSVIDVVLADTLTVGTTLLSQTINTPVTVTQNPDGSTTINKGTIPADVSQIQANLYRDAINHVNENMGKIADYVERHTDEWHEDMDKIILHNMFSNERIAERSTIIKMIYDWYDKPNKDEKSKSFFYSSIENVIEKLGKYQQLIGKSPLLSDLIERYLKDMIEFRHKKETIKIGPIDSKIKKSDVILVILGLVTFQPELSIGALLFRKALNSLKKNDKSTQQYERYREIARQYNPIP